MFLLTTFWKKDLILPLSLTDVCSIQMYLYLSISRIPFEVLNVWSRQDDDNGEGGGEREGQGESEGGKRVERIVGQIMGTGSLIGIECFLSNSPSALGL